jgi:hypothetical protein
VKYDRQTALEIAYRGHDRLRRAISEGKYIVERMGKGYYKFTKQDGTKYETRVHINPEDREDFRIQCTCPFSGEGFENICCKHGVEAKCLEDWEEVYKPDAGLDLRALVHESLKREWEAENAHYDALAKEWEEGQAYQHLCGNLHHRYPTHTHEREDLAFDAII